MRMNPLGRTGIQVSRICLGTMTFGGQNDESEAHAQLDIAFERGVNFLDTAEMYAFPAGPRTQGESERIVGAWMKARKNRDSVVVATKITGPGGRFEHIRGGDMRFGRKQVREAVELSLKRLGTDYIDLYQTHWPARPANYFGKLGYEHDETAQWTPLEETLEAVGEEIEAGRVRAFGPSNETAWGAMEHVKLSQSNGSPRIASIQNPYNLLCRTYEVGLAEVSIREDCGLLAYSPLAFGALTGKYLDGALPDGSRHKLFPEYMRYFRPAGTEATAAYVALARQHGLDPTQMAIAYVNSRRFLTSTIIGATTLEQLETNLAAEELALGDDVVAGIEAIHAANTNPAP